MLSVARNAVATKSLLNGTNLVRNMSGKVPITRLQGKVAVVTASTEGIGFAIARRLAREGAKVMISSRKEKNVTKAVTELKNEGLTVSGLVCHVSNAEDRKKLYSETDKQFGGIDILVSNAAVNPTVGSVLDCDEKSWDKIFDVNVKASYLLAKEVVPYLQKRGGGRIVFVTSIAAYQPFDLLGAYSVSKTALLGIIKAASVTLAPQNITVNGIAPGIIKTKFSAALTDSKSAEEEGLSRIPMNRFGQPDDIAGVAAFIVSDDAQYMTGETIVASGGMPSRL